MTAWDWTYVGELLVGISLGIAAGGYFVVAVARGAAYELLSHPTVRKIAAAAEKLGGKSGGALDGILGFLGLGGKQGPP